jgi:hypothetical protein
MWFKSRHTIASKSLCPFSGFPHSDVYVGLKSSEIPFSEFPKVRSPAEMQ